MRQAGKPNRNVSTIAELGREELRRWLAVPPEPQKERVEVLLKPFHGWEVGPATMIEHVRQTRAEHEALLRRYDRYDAAMSAESQPPAAYWLMTVSCGKHVSKASLEWCDETIAKLEQLPPEPRPGAEDWTPPDPRNLEESE